tara:strand:- start:1156 stop:1617 length:462 start_codon:yes stop_codon:yes gene_type:complete
MEDKIYEAQMQMIKILIANTSSAMKISKIMCEHSNTDVLTGDHIICGLVYRLMVPMTDEEIRESLGLADDIMYGSSSDDDNDDNDDNIDIVEDNDSITERRRGKVQINDCECDVCKKIRECMINFNNYTPNDELGDKFKNSINVTCNTYNRYI